jgi:homoserine kinase
MTRRFVRDSHALSRRTLDAVVVLPPDREEAIVVSGAGPTVWALTRDPLTLEELTGALELSEGDSAAVTSAVELLLDGGALLELPPEHAGR